MLSRHPDEAAFIASFFTYLAFIMQYKANENQRNDIAIERFESNFYEMMHIQRNNLSELKCGELAGREAVTNMCYKLKLIFCLVDSILKKISNEDKYYFQQYCKSQNVKSYIEGETIIAYNLF